MKRYSPKKSKIQKAKVINTVRSFNSKITRTLKKNPELKDFLPQKINTSQFFEKDYASRKDFLNDIDSYQRFLRKGAETPILTNKNAKITKWTKNEIKILDRRKKKLKEKQKKKYEFSTTRGNMGRIKQNNLVHKDFKVMDKNIKEIEKFFKVAENMLSSDYDERSMQIYKDNFINSIKDVVAEDDLPVFKKLLKTIENLSTDELYEMYMLNDDMDIEFWYYNETMTQNERAERILQQIDVWKAKK